MSNQCTCACHGRYQHPCTIEGGCGHLHTGCTVCSAPTGDGARICRTHIRELAGNLNEVADYIAAELDVTITRQDKITPPHGMRPGGEKPLAWNERASSVAIDLHATLNAWALDLSRHHEDERDRLADISTDSAEVALWLRRNVNTLAHHPEAGTGRDEIKNSIDRARQAIDRPSISSRFFVGPCPEADENNVACPGEVWAFIPSTQDKPAMLVCQNDECGAAWNTTQWLRVGGRILDRIEQQRNLGAA